MRTKGWTAAGVGLGASLMYFTDPLAGKRRRSVFGHKVLRAGHQAWCLAGRTGRDALHRARGLFFRATRPLRPEQVADAVLAARVRACLGRVCSHPGAIEVRASGTKVRLDGPILIAERDAVVRAVGKVRGVETVEDALHAFTEGRHHPALQGGAFHPGARPAILQAHWHPTLRLFASGISGGLVAYGSRRRGALGGLSLFAGGLLGLRSLTNLTLLRLFGIDRTHPAIAVHKDITVHVPLEEAYAFFAAFENFPRFMAHVRRVENLGQDRSRWTVDGPGGLKLQWEAQFTMEPNRRVSWCSELGSSVPNEGVVHFESVAGGATRLDIQVRYTPPAGAIGHAVARMLGADPKRRMDEDLLRFKSLLEEGRASGRAGTVLREEVAPRLH